MAKPCEGRKQGSTFENGTVAISSGKGIEFFNSQMLAAAFLLLYALDFGEKVYRQIAIDKGLFEGCFENAEIGGGGVLRHRSFLVASTGGL